MAKTSEELWEEVVAKIPSIAEWTTVAIPILINMNQRLKEHPEDPRFYEIVYPGTSTPVFTEEQSFKLEDLLREIGIVDKELEEEEKSLLKKQVGGSAPVPDAVAGGAPIIPPDIKHTIKKVVDTAVVIRDTAAEFALSSPDTWWEKFKDFLRNQLPELAKHIKEAGETGGLTKYETTLSDLTGVIATPLFPIPYKIPSKTIIPLLSVFLDILRFTISTIPFIGTLSSLPFTLLLAFIELGKGKLYEFFATLFGLIGTNGIILGILTKLTLGSIVLLQPAMDQIPDEMLDAGYKAGKAAIVSFILQFTATISPDTVRLPLTTFTESMKQAARVFNSKIEDAKEMVASSTNDKVHLDMAMIDIDMIPSFMDILSVQRLLQNPAFLSYPGIMDLLDNLRKFFPFNILLDLLNIPHKESDEFKEMVDANPPGSITDMFIPKMQIKSLTTGEYVNIEDINQGTFTGNSLSPLTDLEKSAVKFAETKPTFPTTSLPPVAESNEPAEVAKPPPPVSAVGGRRKTRKRLRNR